MKNAIISTILIVMLLPLGVLVAIYRTIRPYKVKL